MAGSRADWEVLIDRIDMALKSDQMDTGIQRAKEALLLAEQNFGPAMRAIRSDATYDGPDDSWAHPNAWAAFSLIGDGTR